jgi:phosphatidylserine/phosphatidylglycerophosphate/cardiolipin synthase-like enzyme
MSVTFARAAGLLALLTTTLILLLSCSGRLPNTAVSDDAAERAYSGLNAATPIAALIRERGIETPDDSSTVPLLDQVRRELAKSDPTGAYAGVTYQLTRGNTLPTGWLQQSPTRWGHRADDLPFYPLDCKGCEPDVLLPRCDSDTDCANGGTCQTIWPVPGAPQRATRKVCFGHSDHLLPTIHDLVASARRRVDIGVLQPAPATRFLGALRDALDALAATGRSVEVRLLIGQYPPAGSDAAAVLSSLVADFSRFPQARLRVSVGALRTCIALDPCDSFSWPHAKFIAVDGRSALVGGHNLWSEDYLVDAPVHDLSMRVEGPAAASASRFADRLWQFACSNLGKGAAVQWASYPGEGSAPCPASFAPAEQRRSGGIPILAVGRLAAGITTDFADQSDLARDLVLGAARHTIFISQQDFGFTLGRAAPIYPESTIERLIDFIAERDGQVYIVLSNLGATGNSGSTYSNDVSLATFARHLQEVARQRTGRAMDDRLCRNLHLAPLRFGPDAEWPHAQWPHGRPIGNHAKLWMIDEQAFYIGSDNFYPVNLQEFGYIVDDRAAAAQLVESYWRPLWLWSSRAAVSGEEAQTCIFRNGAK